MNYKKQILNRILDQYEKSRTFTGENQVHQTFRADIGRMFPAYLDDARYDVYTEINEACDELLELGLVTLEYSRTSAGRIKSACLVAEKLSEIYAYLSRKPRREYLFEMEEFLIEVEEKLSEAESSDIAVAVESYVATQRKRLQNGKTMEYLDADDHRDVFKILFYMMDTKADQYIRDVSVRLFGDSKRIEGIRNKVESILYAYGDFPDRDSILEECGLIRTPTYVSIKGNVKIAIGGQSIDLGVMPADLAFSTETLPGIISVEVYGSRLVTIENLTTFFDYDCGRTDVAIYLGGFHNRTKRAFLKKVFEENKDIGYYHFGDIDVGGFYIYEHLKKKTGIPFRLMGMDVDTLMSNVDNAKPLTQNDIKRLKKLLCDMGDACEYREVAELMLQKGIKLEQEGIGTWIRKK